MKETEGLKLHHDQWRTAQHAHLIDRFEDPYPTTKLSYLDVFPRSANPQAPDDFEHIPDRTETFWEFMQAGPRLRIIRDLNRPAPWSVDCRLGCLRSMARRI